MATWAEFASEQPALAERVRERFDARRHKTIATLRRDGSPRISGIETEFGGGELTVGMMPGSVKLLDLRRDPRLALHGPNEDPPPGNDKAWAGEAKIAGRAVEDPAHEASGTEGAHFRVDLTEVVFTHLNEAGNKLVVESWREHAGYRRSERS